MSCSDAQSGRLLIWYTAESVGTYVADGAGGADEADADGSNEADAGGADGADSGGADAAEVGAADEAGGTVAEVGSIPLDSFKLFNASERISMATR